jgi:hypothetical protein
LDARFRQIDPEESLGLLDLLAGAAKHLSRQIVTGAHPPH